MNVTVTNLGTIAVPFSSSQGTGFAHVLQPQEPFALDSDLVTVANVGDNPSAAEEFAAGMSALLEKLKELVLFWRERNQDKASDSAGAVRVLIENRGVNALRVLLGSNMNEIQVSPGSGYDATAAEYIEIRELGV